MSTHELTKREAGQEVAEIPNRQPTVMDIVARAAADPNVDVDRLERLIALSERTQTRESEQAFNAAMNEAQAAMRPIAADASNPQTRSKYASYAALDKALRPIYSKHGFSVSFDTADGAPPDYVRVVCKVGHSAGRTEHPHLDMPADGKGAKGSDVMTKTHAVGSAITYGKRYLLGMIFNIAVGEDDDGNAASGLDRPIDADQMQHILDNIASTDTDIEQFCKFMGVDAIKHITVAGYGRAIQALNAKARKAKKNAPGD